MADREGAVAAAESLYRSGIRPNIAAAARIVGVHDAADVAHGAFVEALAKHDPSRGPFQAFWQRITRSRAIDHLRKCGRLESSEDLDEALGDPAPAPDLDALRMFDECRAYVVQKHGEHVWHGLVEWAAGGSDAEIAERYGFPSPDAWRMKRKRVLADLREFVLTRWGGPP